MLQAKDAWSVEYRHLSPSDQRIVNGARNKEAQGPFDLGAYRLLSLQESVAFRRDHPSTACQVFGATDGRGQMKVQRKPRRVWSYLISKMRTCLKWNAVL
eukprot:9362015-Karenia_brevis.AAC.1